MAADASQVPWWDSPALAKRVDKLWIKLVKTGRRRAVSRAKAPDLRRRLNYTADLVDNSPRLWPAIS
jgi:hypothetical protein